MGDAIGYHWLVSQRGISRPSQISCESRETREQEVRQKRAVCQRRETNRAL